jgi:thiosulfate/3-mercaptopyruvate sulfurtransferase
MNPLISSAALADRLADPDLVVIDCRFQLADPQWGRTQYHQSHLPGAYYLDLNADLSAPVESHGGRHPLPDPTTLGEKFAAMGITRGKTPVVAYDDAHCAFAARLWWLLRYYGHGEVMILDGGWPAWMAEQRPVTDAIPAPRSGQFVPRLQPDWCLDREQVRQGQASGQLTLVDARDADRYRGEREPIDPIAGHIPGAVNRPWREATTAAGYLRSPAEQRQRWDGIDFDETVVMYCGSGVTACVNLLSLAIADLPAAPLYPGGWSDWCSFL